jgi:ABC1 atypical kinase-like domain
VPAACPMGVLTGTHGHSQTDHQDPRRSQSQQVARRPPSPELAAQVIAEELGRPPEERFATWDREPIAAASVGQPPYPPALGWLGGKPEAAVGAPEVPALGARSAWTGAWATGRDLEPATSKLLIS